MDLDDVTIGQARELAAMFGPKRETGCLWEIGKAYLIRTVTMTLTGKLVAVTEHELALEDAAWIADTGRYSDALKTGYLSEIEPYPDGVVLVGRGSLVDAAEWGHPLPRNQR